jgi:hypothetical protein
MAKTSLKSKKTKKKSDTAPLVVRKKLPSAWRMSLRVARLIRDNKQPFIIITLVYSFLNLLLVRGFAAGANVSDLKSQLVASDLGSLGSGAGVFVALLGGTGSQSGPAAGVYQLFLGIFTSLAIIWMLRQIMTGTTNVRVKDAFYQGMYPLVPFIAVLTVVALQFIPMLVGSSLYTLVVSNGIAVNIIEKAIWFSGFMILSALSLYWVSSSLIALYIVSLPNMTPMRALRSAKELVAKRRAMVIRKVLWLPLVLLVLGALIMIPLIIVVAPLAQWVFFLLSMFALVVVHSYMYVLYRELLDE